LLIAGAAAIGLPSAATGGPGRPAHWGAVTVRGGTAPAVRRLGTGAPGVTAKMLSYGGGGRTGVVTGAPKVYLVVWGSGWGAGSGTAYANDNSGEIPLLVNFFAGLGTNREGWSRILTQYCASGPTAVEPTNATGCAAGTTAVPYPAGDVYAGLWDDTAPVIPPGATPSASDIALAAHDAALHFNDSSPNSVYVILSAPGTHPDGFNNGSADGFCGWHDDTADTATGIHAPGPDVAFVNMPYVTDAGFACGVGAVHAGAAGTDDGITIVAGHEYAEWLTDPFPPGGWSNASTGDETGDECMWITPGHQGAMSDVPLATGVFPMQSVWSNRGGACITEAVSTVRTAASRQISSVQSVPVTFGLRAMAGIRGRSLIYWAAGLPRGMRIDPRTGRITGRPLGAAGRYTVRISVSDTFGPPVTGVIPWRIIDAIVLDRPATQTTARGARAVVALRATDRITGRHRLRFTASGLPRGLRLNLTTGRITGTVGARAGAYLVRITVTDGGGGWTATRFTWRVR
jgi:hypothetical protein